MKVSKFALVICAALAGAGGALTETACSSSSNSPSSSGGSGSGSGGTMDSGADTAMEGDGAMGTDSGSSSGGMDGGSGVDCGKIPGLHPNPAGDIYCGYGADGGALDCLTGTQCCLGGAIGGMMYDPQVCSAWTADGTGCDNPDGGGIGIACNQVSDCTSNSPDGGFAVCCLQGAQVAMVPGCGYPKAKYGSAIACETATTCAAGETPICSTQADCPSGTTCTAGKWKLYQIGFCL